MTNWKSSFVQGEGITLSPQQVNEWCKSCVTATDELDIATETLERINETETVSWNLSLKFPRYFVTGVAVTYGNC